MAQRCALRALVEEVPSSNPEGMLGILESLFHIRGVNSVPLVVRVQENP